MSTSALAQNRAGEAVAVEYIIEGERTAAAVASRECRLTGVALQGFDIGPVVAGNVDDAIRSLGSRPRVYNDAILGRTVEEVFAVPRAEMFDDVHVMRRLLEHAGLSSPTIPSAIAGCPPQERPRLILEQYQTLPPQLSSAQLDYVYAEIELPVIDPVVSMILVGFLVDEDMLLRLDANYTTTTDIMLRQIIEVLGTPFDPCDDEQLRHLIYCHLAIPVPIWTPNNQPSVNDAALRQLHSRHPVIPLLRTYRSQSQLLRSVRSLIPHIRRHSRRIRGTLDPLGAATGRFTCHTPNLQGLHTLLRPAFLASDGFTLIEADISLAEFRVLAHCSQEPTLLCDLARADVDLHRQTASLLLAKPETAVTDEERQLGKAVNFGIIFGQTEYGLAAELGISLTAAREYINAFFRACPGVRHWIEQVKQWARRSRYVQTLYGRRRDLSSISSPKATTVNEAERQAVNTIIQGSAADLLKLTMAQLYRVLPPECSMLLCIHDSILFSVPTNRCQEMIGIIRGEMETLPLGFSVPIRVRIKTGTTWGQLAAQDRSRKRRHPPPATLQVRS